MRHVIVPVFTDSDLQSLLNCMRFLAQQPSVETVLVLHGPNVGVVNAELTKEFDAKIAQLDTRKRELTLVEDFAGAQRTKEEIEKLRIDRDIAIRDGWKKVPEDQRKAAYAKAFGNLGTEPICLREAYQHDQLFSMLQSFLPQWPSDVPHGEYAIVWPRSVGEFIPMQKLPPPEQGIHRDVKVYADSPTGRAQRERDLRSAHHMKVIGTAQKSGINTKGMKVEQVIQALLDKEFPAQQQAA